MTTYSLQLLERTLQILSFWTRSPRHAAQRACLGARQLPCSTGGGASARSGYQATRVLRLSMLA